MTNTQTKKPELPKYEIAFEPSEWRKWWEYVRMMPGEVGCFGYATIDEAFRMVYVDTLFLVPQVANAAEVDFMEVGLPYAVEKAINDDRLDDLRFCIHSHGALGVYWSTTDEEMIASMGMTADWFVSGVCNKEGKVKGRIDVFHVPPLGKLHVKLDDLAMYEYHTLEQDEAVLAELAPFLLEKPKAEVVTTDKQVVTKGSQIIRHDIAKLKERHGDDLIHDKEQDLYSLELQGGRLWIDGETGIELYYEPVEGEGPSDQEFLAFEIDNDGWALIDGDKYLVDNDGNLVVDRFNCWITEKEIETWDLEDLIDDPSVLAQARNLKPLQTVAA